MKIIKIILTWMSTFMAAAPLTGSLFDYELKTIDGEPMPLAIYKGKANAILLVNTASKCGFTKQYAQLEELYQLYKEKGLIIIGVPSNDFLNQEPGSEAEIKSFCELNYHVTFPLTQKIHVIKKGADPLYQWLASHRKPKWNFHKYLFNKDGELVEDYFSITDPLNENLRKKIEEVLDVSY